MSERRALLEVDDVTIRFGGLTALDSVSFDIQEGEILGAKEGGEFLPRALSPMASRGAGAPMS